MHEISGYLGEPYLLRPKSQVQEDVLFDELVSLPPSGRAEGEVERLSRRGDHFAVGQSHLSGECPGGAGDYGDPVAASELGWGMGCCGRVWRGTRQSSPESSRHALSAL